MLGSSGMIGKLRVIFLLVNLSLRIIIKDPGL
jgi:hypothetical protein